MAEQYIVVLNVKDFSDIKLKAKPATKPFYPPGERERLEAQPGPFKKDNTDDHSKRPKEPN